jgi:hypothetical protein
MSIQKATFTNQIFHLQCKCLGIESTPIDDNSDPLLGDNTYCLLKTIPGGWFISRMLSLSPSLGIVGQIYFWDSMSAASPVGNRWKVGRKYEPAR